MTLTCRGFNPALRRALRHWKIPVARNVFDQLPEVMQIDIVNDSGESAVALATKSSYDLTLARGFLDCAADQLPRNHLTMTVRQPYPSFGTPPFALSDWVGDDIPSLVPRLMFNGSIDLLEGATPQQINEDNGGQVWKYVVRHPLAPRIVWTATFYFASLMDYVDFEIYGVHSYPEDDILEAEVPSLILEFNDPFAMHPQSASRGVSPPEFTPGVGWSTTLMFSETLGDGQGTPIYRGTLFCLPNAANGDLGFVMTLPNGAARLDALYSRADGPVVCTPLGNYASGHVSPAIYPPFGAPRIAPQDPNDADEVTQRTTAETFGMRTPFWDSFRGLSYGSNSPGGQYDFGPMKGLEILTAQQPHHLIAAVHQIESQFRPCHNRELDGSVVRKADHPEWWTYNQRTHFHPNSSPDRLGKPSWWPSFEKNGWKTTDSQHLSWNFHALMRFMLASEALNDMNESLAEIMMADVVHAGYQGIGRNGVRAIGRRLSQGVLHCLHSRDRRVAEERWNRLVLEEISASFDASPFFGGDGEVQPQELQAATPGILRGARPFWVVWEHGLLLNGIASAVAAKDYEGGTIFTDPEGLLSQYAHTVAETLLVFGTREFEVNGTKEIWMAQDVGWIEGGNPIDYETHWSSPTSFDDTWIWGPERVRFGGWNDWVFSGVHFLWKSGFLDELSADAERRITMVDDQLTEAGFASASRETREWWPHWEG